MTTSPYKDQLDQTVWSFSRLKTFVECPASFKKIYLDRCDKVNNAFAEWGSLGHSILEDYAKGELLEYEVEDAYYERYGEYVQHDFPPSRGTPMSEKYFNSGATYFSAFEGFPDNWEVLGAELEANFCIGEYKFIGFIDLLVRDKDDGKLIVIDHKSKAGFKSQQELNDYSIQPYLYSKWVFEVYGEWPKELIFNMFRENDIVVVPFVEDEYQGALLWATTTIETIYQELDFWDKIYLKYEASNKDIRTYKQNDFFCCYLCSCRNLCDRSNIGGL
jgi:hypothetical protein